MKKSKGVKWLAVLLVATAFLLGVTGCGGGEEEEAVSSITILIPEDPAGFNGLVTDTGYEQLLGELLMLSVAEIDPEGNIYPELAVDIPTLENGGVEFNEDERNNFV